MSGLAAFLPSYDWLVALAGVLFAAVVLLGVTRYRRIGKRRPAGRAMPNLSSGLPSISAASRMPSLSRHLHIAVRVYTLRERTNDYDEREVDLETDMFPTDVLHKVFPNLGKTLPDPQIMPGAGEALYRVYAYRDLQDRRMVYRRLVSRSGTTRSADAQDDELFVRQLMARIRAAMNPIEEPDI